MPIVLLTAKFADPDVAWPARGSAETALCWRDGWEFGLIPTMVSNEAMLQGNDWECRQIPAMVRGELAVHRMLAADGFAISIASTGWRISYDGSVFARCIDAMIAAEAMQSACPEWESLQYRGYSDDHSDALSVIIEAATRCGQILLDRVYPSG